MSQQILNVGDAANDGKGDKIRVGAEKIAANFAELYAAVLSQVHAYHVYAGDDLAGLPAFRLLELEHLPGNVRAVVALLNITQSVSPIGTGVKTIAHGPDSSINFGSYVVIEFGGVPCYIPCSLVAPT